MKKKIESLMTKKEQKIVQDSSLRKLKAHSVDRLKQFIKLTRKLRDKYRDLTRRQKLANRGSQNLRTTQKAKLFKQALDRYEKRYEGIREARG